VAGVIAGAAVVLMASGYVDALRHLGPLGSAQGLLAVTATLLGRLAVPVVGAVLVRRVPDSRYGWVWCAFGLALGVNSLQRAPEPSAPAPGWMPTLVFGIGFLTVLGSIVLVFLLFPDGRPPSPSWRWPGRATVALVAVMCLAVPLSRIDGDAASPWPLPGRAADRLGDAVLVGVGLLFGLCLLGMAGTVVRWRRASEVEGKQLEWFASAAIANGALILTDLVGLDEVGPLDSTRALWPVLEGAAFLLMPVAVAVAVLRYRLYEIDRIVSRTVTYGLVTGSLLAAYAGLVYLLRRVLEPLIGTTQVAVAASTLAVAALFRPLLRRVRSVVDRRFDRSRYDAARTVDAYARRLRTEVDLDEVTAGLRNTVSSTVGPQRVALWLRDAPAGRGVRT
jgi:hypothetical protein